MNTQDRNPQQIFGPVRTLLLGIALAVVVGLVGVGDYEQEVADAEFTRMMIEEGSWPGAATQAREEVIVDASGMREPVVPQQIAGL
ncbi:hypothetical protein [Pseudomonas sp. GD03730]|uniref:hypothetical protein n=1 Tax=Pseudomonas sp. GD03730 TaxID=2975375 RepID=UPI002446C730|nr:hypothetical protein [Pseudomonas sp. GD03730]MDH1403757.1 hypothetical protein [Pseudomonas sp. GD03730]